MGEVPGWPEPTSVTVVFTDLVDSTAIRGTLGEERADELRRVHERLVVAAIGDHGGHVVKGTGDGVLATFPSATAGLAAAVALQQRTDRYSRGDDALAPLSLRVGLSVGDVVFEDGDCHGMPVVEAARLMSHARGGQIVCADVVRVLARGRGDHRFRSLGELQLKGITEAVPASEVAWDPLPIASHERPAPVVPLPVQLGTETALPFVSREVELKQVCELLDAPRSTLLQIVWLEGPPGIGKSRLASEAAQRVHGGGALVLFGRCDADRRVPFLPFIEALRTFVDAVGAEALLDELGDDAAELVRLVPSLAVRHPALVPSQSVSEELDSYRLCEAIGRWLAAQSARRPVLLVLDDIHWADRRTLGAVAHLLRSAVTGVVLIATARSTAPDASDELSRFIAEAGRSGRSTQLKLDALDVDDVGELVSCVTIDDDDASVARTARRLHHLSGGNPLFLRSLLDAVRESGRADIELPADVHAAVRARVGVFPDELRHLLDAAALRGLEFELSVVAAATDQHEDHALDLLELATHASLVEEIGLDRYRFVHALVREALVTELSHNRRSRMHLRLAQALDRADHRDDPSVLTALAYHYGAGARDDATRRRAVDLYREVAARQADLLDHDAAAGLLDEALVLVAELHADDGGLRAALLGEKGHALRRAGRTADALEAFEATVSAAVGIGDATLAVRAAVAYERTAWPAGLGHALTHLERALAVGPCDDHDLLLADAARTRQLEFARRHVEALEVGETTLAHAHRSGTVEHVAHATFALSFVRRTPSAISECAELERQSVESFAACGDVEMFLQALGHRANTLRRLGRGSETSTIMRELVARCAELRQPFFDYVGVNHAYLLAFGGADLAAATTLADRALDVGSRLLGEDPSGLHGLRMFLLRRERDELTRIGPLLARLMAREPVDRLWRPGLLALHVAIGQLDEARDVLTEIVAPGLEHVAADFLPEGAMGFLAEAALALHDAELAEGLEPLLSPYRELTLTLGFFAGDLGSGARALAMLARARGEHEQAVALTHEAIAFNRDQLGNPLWTAHTLVDLYELTADRRALDDARALASRHQLAAVGRRCQQAVPVDRPT